MPKSAANGRLTRSWLYLLAITAAGAFLRLIDLTAAPPALHFDEAVYGLLAREIGPGNWPIYMSSYTGREPLYMYLMAAIFRLFGSTEWTLRFTSALIGIATIPLAYLLFRLLFGERVGLLSAALTALSYWHLSVSRAGYPNVLIPPIECLAAFFLLSGYRNASRWRMALGGALVGLVLWTYLAARFWPITLLLWALYALCIEPRRMLSRWQGWALAVVACLIVFGPLGIHFVRQPEDFVQRAGQVLVFGNASSGEVPGLLAHNLVQTLGGLVVRGDPRIKFNLPGRPVFMPWMAAFFVWGVVRACKNWRRVEFMLLPIWTVGMCLPAILTQAEMPQSQRMSGVMPGIFALAALGLDGAWSWLQSRNMRQARTLASAALVVLILSDGALAAHTYLNVWARDPVLFYSEHGDYNLVAHRAAHELQSGRLPVVIAKHYKHASAAFLEPGSMNAIWSVGDKTLVMPSRGREVIYLWPPHDSPLRQELRDILLVHSKEQAPLRDPGGEVAVRVFTLEPEALSAEAALPNVASFGQEIGVLDWELDSSLSRDRPVRLLVHWRALASIAGGRVLSVHIYDEQGLRWAERTSLGFMPEQWQPGDTIYQLFELELPRGIPAGGYQARLLMSHEGGQDALPLIQDGALAGSYMDLGWFTLTPEGATVEPLPDALHHELVSGMRIIERGQWPDAVRQGDTLDIRVVWQAAQTQEQDLSVDLALVDDAGQTALTQTFALGLGYPTSQWQPLEVVQARYAFPLRSAPAGAYHLQLRLGEATLELGQLSVEAVERSFDLPAIDHAVEACFGDQISLLGYSLPDHAYAAGDVVPLTLHWRAEVSPAANYKVFVHLVDAQGKLWAQRDAEPADWARPTLGWIAGEIVSDAQFLALPGDLPAGAYTLYAGLYEVESLQRLRTAASPDGRVRLGALSIE